MLNPKLNIEESYGKLRALEMSQKYAITSALIYHLWRGTDEKDQDIRVAGFFRILKKMSSEFASMGCLGAMAGTDTIDGSKACEILSESDGWEDFLKEHHDVITKKVDVNIDEKIDID